MNGAKYISELINENIILGWKSGENIMIDAGTGAGKTTFAIVGLSKIASRYDKKVIIYVPRTMLKKQKLDDIQRYNDDPNNIVKITNVDIELYQKLENEIRKDKEATIAKLNDYMFVVSDECHYFFTDSGMNINTPDSLDILLKLDTVKIFMSATPDMFKQKCIDHGSELTLFNFDSMQVKIDSLTFYSGSKKNGEDAELEQITDLCISNYYSARTKAVIFVQKIKTGVKLYKKYKNDAIFFCSERKPEYKKYVDEVAIANMMNNKKFDKAILITTSALDVGFSLEDSAIDTIIIDGFIDIGTIKQLIGRKRNAGKGDRASLLIKKLNNRSINSWRSRLLGKLRMAEDFRTMELQQFIQKYFRKSDALGIIYDDFQNGVLTKGFNDERYRYYKNLIKEYEQIISVKPYGMKKYISDAFGLVPREDWDISDNKDLKKYLELLYEKGEVMLSRTDREPFLERLNIRRNGRVVKNKDALNSLFKNEYHIKEYEIKEFITNRKVTDQNGNEKIKKFKYAWKIVKL